METQLAEMWKPHVGNVTWDENKSVTVTTGSHV